MSEPSRVEAELIRRLVLSKITNEEFLDTFPDRLLESADFVDLSILRALKTQDPWAVQLALIVLNVQTGNYRYTVDTAALCRLLFQKWHYSHEDIAFFLQLHPDPKNLDCLYMAAQLRFEYLAYDETFQFARKCIKAIYAIGTTAAFERLRLLTEAPEKTIAKYARKELNREHQAPAV